MLGTRHYPRSQVVSRLDQRDASLVLYLPLPYQYSDMTGSTIYSYDRNRHTGTVTTATWGSQGRTFVPATNDQISVAHHAALNLTTDMSAFMWVKVNAFTSVAGYLNKYASGPDSGFILGTNLSTGSLRAYLGFANASVNGSSELAVGGWRLVGFTWTVGGGVDFYSNGAITVTSAALTNNISTNTTALIVSGTAGGLSRVDGTIGEIWVYNRKVPLAEAKYLYQVTKGPPYV